MSASRNAVRASSPWSRSIRSARSASVSTARSGSAVRAEQREQRLAPAAEPLEGLGPAGGVEEADPDHPAAQALGSPGAPGPLAGRSLERRSAYEVGEGVPQRAPRSWRPLGGGGGVVEEPVHVDAGVAVRLAVVLGPAGQIAGPASGWHCTPQTDSASRAACGAPSGVRARTRAPSGRPVATSTFQCDARSAPVTVPSSGSAGGLVEPADRHDGDGGAGRVAADLAAERQHGQLVAEAQTERRHALGGRLPDQLAGRGQPRVAGVVPGVHAAAEHQQARRARRGPPGRSRSGPSAYGRRTSSSTPVGLEPLPQPAGRGARLVLHDQDARCRS